MNVSGKAYRGSVMVRPTAPGSIELINLIDVESYLRSVVPSEMPSSWPIEALKAQAIAARSYAIASLGKHDADGYDVKPNTEDQVYSGMSSENPATDAAVAQTQRRP